MKEYVCIESKHFSPKDGYSLVIPDVIKTQVKTESGLILESRREESIINRPTSGVIVKSSEFKVGSRIHFPMTDGLDLVFDDGEFMLIRDASVYGTSN